MRRVKIETHAEDSSWKHMEELILLRWPYYPEDSTDLMQFLSNYHDVFHRTRMKNLKIYMKPQKTPNCQGWRLSYSQTSDYITKLQ